MVSRILVATIFSMSAHGIEFNDPLFGRQWNIHNNGQIIQRDSGEMTRNTIHGLPGTDVNWTSMKSFSIPTGRQILVAFLDSGLDVSHPELKDRIPATPLRCFFKGEKKGNDDVCHGYNALQDNSDLIDTSGHGTHTVGILAAKKNNHEGIVGMTDERIKILPVKVVGNEINRKSFSYKGKLITEYIARGIEYALEQGADVINISLGWPELAETQAIDDAFDKAFKRDIPIIAAAGNNNKQIPVYPCSDPRVICVGAVDVRGQLTEFSNFGGKVDILAPGEQIVSTFPQGENGMESPLLQIRGYERKSGTSQAAPAVTAVVASLKLLDPTMSVDEIKSRIYSTARSPSILPQTDKFAKNGIIDMRSSLSNRPKTFIDIDYKKILEVPFDLKSGNFFFTLPLRSLIRKENGVRFQITQDNPSLQIDNPEGKIDLPAKQTVHLPFQGTVLDDSGDSRTRIQLHLYTKENHFTSQTTIFLAQKLKTNHGIPLQGTSPAELIKSRQDKKFTPLKLVADSEYWKDTPSYFISQPNTLILWEQIDGVFVRRKINIPGLKQVGAVFRSDLDLDGQPDIFVYGIDEKRQQIFTWLNENGQPLIPCTPNGQATFPKGNTFGFLPLKYRFQENFSWIRQETTCGMFKVPVIHREYSTPPEDDSDDIIERNDDGAKNFHNYVLTLSPSKQGLEIKPRIIESFQMKKNLRRQYNFLPIDPVILSHPFEQSVKNRRLGRLDGMATLGIGIKRISLTWSLDQYGKKLKTKIDPNFYHNLQGYKIIPLKTLSTPFIGTPGIHNALILPERSNMVEIFLGTKRTPFSSDSWNDVIFNVLDGFESEHQTTLFVEGRYHLHALDPVSGWKGKLRINRDSSLPGSALTETIAPVHVMTSKENQMLPGLQINNTLVHGQRLYVMLRQGEKFYLPLKLSILIPPTAFLFFQAVKDGCFITRFCAKRPY